MAYEQSLVFTYTVQTAPAEVCRAFTHATLLRDWLSDAATVEPRPGGYLFLHWRDGRTVTGHYEKLHPPEGIQFTWMEAGRLPATRIRVACAGEGQGTQLTLTHEPMEGEVGWETLSPRLEALWGPALENLGSVLESGIDLRQACRPRLGIIFDELTQEKASKLGVPVLQGVLLHGTAEGSGAQAAGLSKDDVLVSLNGVSLLGPYSFDSAMRGLKAGDRPLVEYYRGAEKHSTPLELGTFPLPEVPTEPVELAAQVRAQDAEMLGAMRKQLAGLSEVQAAARPVEGEWSVRELVAHFVLCERDYQSWIAAMLNDTPVEDWLEMRPNVQPRIDALIARLRGLPELLEEFHLAQEETAALIAAFPDSFAHDRKHLYRRAAQWVLEVRYSHYFEEHKEQFQAAIAAAEG